METIVIATIKSWNIAAAREFARKYRSKYSVVVITEPHELTAQALHKLAPKFIFFPHWSWIIPEEIHSQFPCVVFHMTDLPSGRGGSPLQNLLSRGMYTTKISALRVDGGLDTGPIYCKRSLSLRTGSADTLFKRASRIIFSSMIPAILEKALTPQPQTGAVTAYKRRKPAESNLLQADRSTVSQYYDFIRMLDGEGYPPAYIELPHGYILQLSNAKIDKGLVKGAFRILPPQ